MFRLRQPLSSTLLLFNIKWHRYVPFRFTFSCSRFNCLVSFINKEEFLRQMLLLTTSTSVFAWGKFNKADCGNIFISIFHSRAKKLDFYVKSANSGELFSFRCLLCFETELIFSTFACIKSCRVADLRSIFLRVSCQLRTNTSSRSCFTESSRKMLTKRKIIRKLCCFMSPWETITIFSDFLLRLLSMSHH